MKRIIAYLFVLTICSSLLSCDGKNSSDNKPPVPAEGLKAPSAVQVTAGDKIVTITWNAVKGAASYQVFYHTDNNVSEAVQFIQDNNVSDTTCIITGLTNTIKYYIWVRSKNEDTLSDFSKVVSCRPLSSLQPPVSPDTPNVTAGNEIIIVNWLPVDTASEYEVYYHTVNNTADAVLFSGDTNSSDTTCEITGLTNGTTYYIWIKAKNSAGTSDFSPYVEATPVKPIEIPGTPEKASVKPGGNVLHVSWTPVNDAVEYKVYYSQIDDTSQAILFTGDEVTTDTNCTIQGLTPGTIYYVWIKASNSAGDSDFSPSANGTPFQFECIGDINKSGGQSPENFVKYKSKIYFLVKNSNNINTVWVYDGMQKPGPVSDINDQNFERIDELVVLNDKLYFSARDKFNTIGTWSYNGVEKPVYEFNKIMMNVMPYQNSLCFYSVAGLKFNFYQYDGTNLKLLKENFALYLSNYVSWEQSFLEFNGKLYFPSSDYQNGFETWVYDNQVLVPLTDIEPVFEQLSLLSYPTIFNGKMYFQASDGSTGKELWVYDGINAPELISDIYTGSSSSNPEFLIVHDGNLFFNAYTNETGQRLWKYNGINTPTMFNENISCWNKTAMISHNNKLYFTAKDMDLRSGYELSSCDGESIQGELSDINPGSEDSFPSNFFVFNNKLHFVATDDQHGFEIWSFDESEGAKRISDTSETSDGSNLRSFIKIGNTVYFVYEISDNESRLYQYDGIHEANRILENETEIKVINSLAQFNNKLYMSVIHDTHGRCMMEYDGSGSPALVEGTAGLYINLKDAITFKGKLIFHAAGSYDGNQIWSYDGTGSATMIDNFGRGDMYYDTKLFTIFKDSLYYLNKVSGKNELYVYNGINEPQRLKTLYPDLTCTSVNYPVVYNDQLYFVATDDANGQELWKYDSNTIPSIVFDLLPGYEGSNPASLMVFNEKLIFKAKTGDTGYELWAYDNETNSVDMVADIKSGSESSNPNSFVEVNNKLYFYANDGDYGRELYHYDGSAVNLVIDIKPGYLSSEANPILDYNGSLLLCADDDFHGRELFLYSE